LEFFILHFYAAWDKFPAESEVVHSPPFLVIPAQGSLFRLIDPLCILIMWVSQLIGITSKDPVENQK
jgi:hypothetical protein